ncbi:MAG: glutathione transferase GstA [Sneathiella sp.]|nr:glutathione transferase GstA [Sneathiella sp.]
MRLFYKPGACSLASHIVLKEVGVTFSVDEVDTQAGRTKFGRDFKQLNPKGYVPALELETGEVITEGASILQYIADKHPENQLAPAAGTIARARMQEHLNYTSSELHKAFGPLFSDNATDAQKVDARENVAQKIDYMATLLKDGQEYLVENKFTVADAYVFVVLNWANFTGIDLNKWPNIAAYVARIAARPSTKEAMLAEGLL